MPIYKQSDPHHGIRIGTAADFNKASEIIKDKLHIVTASEETSRVITTPFRYNQGINELEVYLNGLLLRCKENILGTEYGEYEEQTNFSVKFEPGIIKANDLIRFRITSNSYDRSNPNFTNIIQLSKDLYGRDSNNLLHNDGKFFAGGSVNALAYATDIIETYNYYHIGTINNAILDIGSDYKMLIIPNGTWLINKDLTIPSNIGLKIEQGAMFYLDSSSTIIINGPFEAEPCQVFDCVNGNVYFGSENIMALPEWWGAKGDGITNDTYAIQSAINSANNVLILEKTYMCANILIKDNLYLSGKNKEKSILKLLPNALLSSYNGSQADSNGRYPGNVLCSTLNHNGGDWYDGGTRAKDENNSTYIYENVVIEKLTIDGNKSNNQIGDFGQNASAMGAGISIHQCKNVVVMNCNIINNRLDGVHVGYSLHGGSDYCLITSNTFSGNQRTNIALITGKYNVVSFNRGTNATGGTGVGAGVSLDIESNLTDEVNYRHMVYGNNLGGGFGIVSLNSANQTGTKFFGNIWKHMSVLGDGNITSGCVIDGDSFYAEGSSDWLLRYGTSSTPTNIQPTVIKNCYITDYNRVLHLYEQGGQENLSIENCNFNVGSIGTLTRGYKVSFIGNTFNFSGNVDTETIYLVNTLGNIIPNQGQVKFIGNKFLGTSNTIFLKLSRNSTWTESLNDFQFLNNEVNVTGATYLFSDVSTMTIKNNIINSFKSINISVLYLFCLIDNIITASSSEYLLANQSSTFYNNEISGNIFTKVNINLVRPKDTIVCSNRFYDCNITIVYSYTSNGVGRSHISFNRMTSTTNISNPFIVTVGGGFNSGDFVGKDQYKYNTYVGYVSGASINGGMAGCYDGSFD